VLTEFNVLSQLLLEVTSSTRESNGTVALCSFDTSSVSYYFSAC